MTWAVRRSLTGSGHGKRNPAARLPRQLRRMGASVDWARERFYDGRRTIGGGAEVFVRLYEEGLIYRGQRLVNWDPVLHTAVFRPGSGQRRRERIYVAHPLSAGRGGGDLIVATTRPETLLGDSAVAVHPDDVRYQRLIGESRAAADRSANPDHRR